MDDSPAIRIWARNRRQFWSEFWTLDTFLERSLDLIPVLRELGAPEIDICPVLQRDPGKPGNSNVVEVFIAGGVSREIRDRIQAVTWYEAEPSPVKTVAGFRQRVARHYLYQRQVLQHWDGRLPCLILAVDFDEGRNWRVRPARPEQWRRVDHQVDGTYCGRRVMSGLPLEPNEKGQKLLAELSERFFGWFGGYGCNSKPSLNAILEYREVLLRHGVDCNGAFRDELAEGWYPMDLEREVEAEFIRELCSTPLPENIGHLLVGEDGQPADSYSADFQFVALTQNSD